jgi:teichoic acid transport system ATP-binding protein
MEPSSGISARVLAPAALVVCALLFIFVIATSSGGGGDSDKGDSAATQKQSSRTTTTKRKPRRVKGSTYTVKTGDTLGSISEKTGVGVEQLQELNPQLDPQALVSGQKLKIR